MHDRIANTTPRIFAMISNTIHTGRSGGSVMRRVELFRRRAEECLDKAKAVSERHERQAVRLLLVQAHNHLKQAEETEAQELNARA
jgi:hypothetical protein